MVTCQAVRKDGQPCTAPVMRTGATRCFAHDRDLQDRRDEARRQGGRSKANMRRMAKLMPARLTPLFDSLDRAFDETHAGDLDPRAASALAQLARAMIACVTAGELEQRLRALEEAAPQPQTPRWRA